MFSRFYNILHNIKSHSKNAFRVYLFASILSIISGILCSIIVLFGFQDDKNIWKYFLLCFFLVFVALDLESINFKIKNKFIRYMLISGIVIISGLFVYFNIIILMESSDIAVLKYCMLLLSICVLFVAFNLRFNFYSFYSFLKDLYFVFFVVLLLAILFGILFLSIDFLFNIPYDVFRLNLFCLIVVFTIAFIFFIGKVSLLNHYLMQPKEELEIIKNKNLNYIFLIFCVFAYCYISILFVYFLLLFIGVIDEQYSAIHLIIWFSFFGMVLFWLNKSFDTKYFGKLFLTSLFALNIIAFYSICIRIDEYGFTPSRYFVFISCLFLFVAIIFSLLLHFYLKILLYLFSFLCVISSFGSLSALNVSIASQLNELKKLELTNDNLNRISNICYFLNDFIDDDRLKKCKDFIDSNRVVSNKIHYKAFDTVNVFDVKNFDVLINVQLYDGVFESGDYKFTLHLDRFEVYKNGQMLLSVDHFYDTLINQIENNISEIELNHNGNKMRLYVYSIRYDTLEHFILSMSFDVLIKHNNIK